MFTFTCRLKIVCHFFVSIRARSRSGAEYGKGINNPKRSWIKSFLFRNSVKNWPAWRTTLKCFLPLLVSCYKKMGVWRMASYAMGAVRKGEVCMGGRGTRGGGEKGKGAWEVGDGGRGKRGWLKVPSSVLWIRIHIRSVIRRLGLTSSRYISLYLYSSHLLFMLLSTVLAAEQDRF